MTHYMNALVTCMNVPLNQTSTFIRKKLEFQKLNEKIITITIFFEKTSK